MKRKAFFLTIIGFLLFTMLVVSCNTHKRGKRRSSRGCDCPKFSQLKLEIKDHATTSFG